MRTSWKLLAPLLAFGLVAAACGGDDDDSASTTTAASGGATETSAEAEGPETFPAGSSMARIQEAGTIKIGTKFDQPLFGERNPTNGEIEGFDAEIGRLIAAQIFGEGSDDKIEFIETPSRVREQAIIDGQVDIVIATYTINDARKQQVDFAGPYYEAGQDILVKADDDSIKGVDDLNGKKVCTVQGSTSLTNVQTQAPQADVSITFDKYSLCVEALLDGRVQAVTTDNVILLGFVEEYPDEVKLVDNPFTEEPYGIGLKKGDTEFRNWINDQLELFDENGSYAEAWDATAGVTGQEAPSMPAVNRY
jgi:glutamate transport system substrate-binding protein